MYTTMSLPNFDDEQDDVNKLLEDEEQHDKLLDDIQKTKDDQPDPVILKQFIMPVDPMSYLNFDSEATSMQNISSDESQIDDEDEHNVWCGRPLKKD